MDGEELERYLHEHIPLSAAMRVRVAEIGVDFVALFAPLAPNINHRATAFGGESVRRGDLIGLVALALEACSGWPRGAPGDQSNTMSYEAPAEGEFLARAALRDAGDWTRFVRAYQRKGIGRIASIAQVTCRDQLVGRMIGEFVALSPATAR